MEKRKRHLSLFEILLVVAIVTVVYIVVFTPLFSHCIVEGTQIDTPTGKTPVESLALGDRVLSRSLGG